MKSFRVRCGADIFIAITADKFKGVYEVVIWNGGFTATLPHRRVRNEPENPFARLSQSLLEWRNSTEGDVDCGSVHPSGVKRFERMSDGVGTDDPNLFHRFSPSQAVANGRADYRCRYPGDKSGKPRLPA